MYRQSGSPVRLDYPVVMLAQAHLQELEREIDQFCLAAQVDTEGKHTRPPMPAVLAWVCTKLMVWLPRQRTGLHGLAPGELSDAAVQP